MKYKVGDRVTGQFRDGRWYPATITAVNAEASTYTLNWTDGKQDDRIKNPSLVRDDPSAPAPAPLPEMVLAASAPARAALSASAPAPASTPAPAPATTSASAPARPFKVGDIVKAPHGAGGEFHSATVAEVRADGTYLLAWGSGATDDRVRAEAALRAYTGPSRSCLVSHRPIAVGDRFVLKDKHGPVLLENLEKYEDMKKSLLTGFE
jgi:hypothetical protein